MRVYDFSICVCVRVCLRERRVLILHVFYFVVFIKFGLIFGCVCFIKKNSRFLKFLKRLLQKKSTFSVMTKPHCVLLTFIV